MDLTKTDLKKLFLRYLFASLGSALLTSVYSLVDAAMVGAYYGAEGTAALALIMPLWTMLFSLGLLFGLGGGILYAKCRGEGNARSASEYFTVSLIGVLVVSAVLEILFWVFDRRLLTLFGGTPELVDLAEEYFFWLKIFGPLFTIGQMLTIFIRNDGDPFLATFAVVLGGVINVFGDWYFVFYAFGGMGMKGAGLATVLGQTAVFLVLGLHFFKKKNALKLVRPSRFPSYLFMILRAGFSAFVIDISSGVLAIVFNNQIQRFLGLDALGVYGVILNVMSFVVALSYGIGEAAQPICSANLGARRYGRVAKTFDFLLASSLLLGLVFSLIIVLFPLPILSLFIALTPDVSAVAPAIIRVFALSFLLLPVNISLMYYLQSILRSKLALALALARGILLSGFLALLLPALFGGSSLWWAMPVTELVVFIPSLVFSLRFTAKLKKTESANNTSN